MNLKKSRFTEHIISLNSLSFRRWVFEPGMEFRSEAKWWGDRGDRGQPHNGLDILFYETPGGELKTIDENTKIPVIYPGRIVKRDKDFLGYTLFATHEIFDGDRRLCTLYGHVLQTPDIVEDADVDEGGIIATLPPGRRSKAPSHLHISVVLIPADMPVKELSWKKLDESEGLSFIDPQGII